MRTSLRDAEISPPEDGWERLERVLSEPVPTPVRKPAWRIYMPRIAAAAAVVLIGVVAGDLLLRPDTVLEQKGVVIATTEGGRLRGRDTGAVAAAGAASGRGAARRGVGPHRGVCCRGSAIRCGCKGSPHGCGAGRPGGCSLNGRPRLRRLRRPQPKETFWQRLTKRPLRLWYRRQPLRGPKPGRWTMRRPRWRRRPAERSPADTWPLKPRRPLSFSLSAGGGVSRDAANTLPGRHDGCCTAGRNAFDDRQWLRDGAVRQYDYDENRFRHHQPFELLR